METLENIFSNWKNLNVQIDKRRELLRAETSLSFDEIELKLKSEFGPDYDNSWFNKLIPPIAEQIKKSGGYCKVESFGPTGLCCMVSLYCYLDDSDTTEKAHTITLSPDLEEICGSPLMLIDRSKRKGEYEIGTIGYNNGLDHPMSPVHPKTKGDDWLALLSKPF